MTGSVGFHQQKRVQRGHINGFLRGGSCFEVRGSFDGNRLL
ncbi:MAG: hypothetical protein JWR89_5119, partial [Tardiphaga sp.]|nr:hypothetical protein [Tardiphaga sp.]